MALCSARKNAFLSFCLLAVVASCSDRPLPNADGSTDAVAHDATVISDGCLGQSVDSGCVTAGEEQTVKALSLNLYIGADVTSLFAITDPSQVPGKLQELFTTIEQTNFNERAGRLAELIKQKNPDIIGLQEVSHLIRTNTADSTRDRDWDYLQIMLDALTAQGLTYTVAAEIENVRLDLSLLTAPDNITVTDRDVLLVRQGVTFDQTKTIAKNYTLNLLPITIGALTFQIKRGYVITDIQIDNRTYRVANTHLESVPNGVTEIVKLKIYTIQHNQAGELLEALQTDTRPVIVLGDFNSTSPPPTDAPQNLILPPAQFRAAHYLDIWEQTNSSEPGFTCCQDEKLDNDTSKLSQRIDYVLLRNDLGLLPSSIVTSATASLISHQAADKTTPAQLWPSDHAGVFAEITIPKLELR